MDIAPLLRTSGLPIGPGAFPDGVDRRVGSPIPLSVRRGGTLTLDRRGRIVQIDAPCAAKLVVNAREAIGGDIADHLSPRVVQMLSVTLESYASLWTADSARTGSTTSCSSIPGFPTGVSI